MTLITRLTPYPPCRSPLTMYVVDWDPTFSMETLWHDALKETKHQS